MYAKIVDAALKARENAYSPYSNFKVGAALLTPDSKIYTGANVECASYGATNCAERTAFFKAVSEGERSFTSIAVAGSADSLCYPCGVCLQVMAEFCDADKFEVIVVKNDSDYLVYKLKELLPYGFVFKKND